MRVRVRLFAIQRELAGTREVALDLPDGATIEDAWDALVERSPGARAGPAVGPVRAERRLRRPPRRALADGDEVAFIPPVSGGADAARDACGSSSSARRRSRATILAELDRPARDARGRRGRRVPRPDPVHRPGTPAPGQEAEAARHAGRSRRGARVRGPRRRWRSRSSATIADEIAARFGVDSARDRPSDRARCRSARRPSPIVAVRAASRRGVRRRPLRDRRDEGPRPDLEGRAVRRRPRLDRRAGPRAAQPEERS